MIKKKSSSLAQRIVKFWLYIFMRPNLIRLYYSSNKKLKYSLRDVKKTGILFLHIPKCAGVSVNNSLYGSLGVGHTTLNNALIGLGPFEYANVFKFTIVRNPWDRLVSAYFFLEKGGFGERDKTFFSENLSNYRDFDDFVLNWVTTKNVMLWNHFIPQSIFLSVSNTKVDLDFLCFFESLEEDFEFIYDAKRWMSFKTLSDTNGSDHKNYRQYYTDASKKVVEEVYADDIEFFGYDFDGKKRELQKAWRAQEFPI